MYELHNEDKDFEDDKVIENLYESNLIEDEDQEYSEISNFLQSTIKEPQHNLFELDISENEIDQQNEPKKSLSQLVDQLLFSISNNQEILNNTVRLVEEEEAIEDTFDEFEFRNYQMELYEKGIGKNSIIYLETGLGKTLVIIMLMWDRLIKFPQKKIVFLANTVQLVEQQAQQIRRKLPKVAELLSDDERMVSKAKECGSKLYVIHGSKCTDIWNQIMWQIILEESSILVMTTQIFLNILRKGLTKISNFSFIAMDECHYAIQDHPYNYILKEFYLKTKLQSQNEFLPQIVGATASPVINSKSVANNQLLQQLVQLAANMDAQYLHIDNLEVKQHVKEAKIIPIFYKMLFNDTEIQKVIDLKSSLQNCEKNENKTLDVMRKNNYLQEFFELKQIFENLQKKYQNEIQTKILISQIEKQLLINGFQMYLELGQHLLVLLLDYVIIKMNDFLTIKRPQNQNAIIDILKILKRFQQDARLKYQNVYQSSTPKVQILLDLVKKAYKQGCENNMMLIFVKQRLTAFFLNKLFEGHFAQEDLQIKSDFIIGHCSSIVRKQTNSLIINVIESNKDDQEELIKRLYDELQNDQSKFSIEQLKEQVNKLNIFAYNTSPSAQIDILNKFRQGKLQILISTSVAEEGIDIPMCNYVIGFNPISSSKAYVQMKGRARKENSQFMIFMVDRTQQAKVQSHQQVQTNIKQIIEELIAPQRQQILCKAIQSLQIKTFENTYYDSFEIDRTGAQINTNWSCQLIQNLCQKCNSKEVDRVVPKYAIYQLQGNSSKNEQYIAFLLLPMSLKSFIFYGKLTSTSKDARSSAAFEASVQLYQKGYLDDNLEMSFDCDLGLHIGADQDDSQIMMTKEQWQIACKHSQRLVHSQSKIGGRINSQKRYYNFLFKSIFSLSSQEQFEDFILYECQFENQGIQLCYPKQMFNIISQVLNTFSALGIKFLQMTKISKTQYVNFYNQYIQTIIKEEKLKLISDDIYSVANKQYQIRISNQINYNLLIIVKDQTENNLKLSYIVNQFSLRFKVKQLKDKIKDHLVKINPLAHFNVNLQVNEVLNFITKYVKCLTSLKFQVQEELEESNLNFIQYSVSDNQMNVNITEILDKILFQSLDVQSHNHNNLLLGFQYYKLLISVILYANYFHKDIKIVKAKYKTLTRSTYVRNCLLETYLFFYLHKNEQEDISKIFIGLDRYQANFDLMMEQLIFDDFSLTGRRSERKAVLNKIHFSNQEFFQFIQQSLFLIQEGDCYLENGLNWLRTFKITNSMKINISSSKLLSNFIPQAIPPNDLMRQLKKSFSSLENQIKYQFTHFELLFQAMTDISFKFVINNKLKYKYYEQFSKKEEYQGFLTEQQWLELKTQFECMNETDQNNYENSLLALLGKALWNYIIIKILIEMQLDEFAIRILGKFLQKTPFIGYLAIQLQIHKYLNSSFQNSLFDIANDIQQCKDQSLVFKISHIQKNSVTQSLEIAFFALLGAIYLDSNTNINIAIQWVKLQLEEENVQQLYSLDFIKRQPKYQFYKWYQSKIGNPFNFNLIKIPHQDFRKIAQGENLYIPYDMLEAQIVNIKGDKYCDISQLHIYSKSKANAWNKLYELIDY